jgi:hypothetical protein
MKTKSELEADLAMHAAHFPFVTTPGQLEDCKAVQERIKKELETAFA